MQETNLSYSVIINSIGTATPVIAKLLSDSFNIKKEIILKLLYCTPSVIFQNIDEDNAKKASELLNKLGLDVSIINQNHSLPDIPELYDIAIYIHDPLKLPAVTGQLAEFLGCSAQEAFNLLLNEPSVVLGSVSKNTAISLSSRIDAEVVMSKPDADLYTISVLSGDENFQRQLKTVLNISGINFDQDRIDTIENIEFEKSREIWRRMNSSKYLSIVNQSFHRYEIILNDVDIDNIDYFDILTGHVGMPQEIIDEVLNNLPVVLNESVNRSDLQELMAKYKTAGLKCTYNQIPAAERQIVVKNFVEINRVKEVFNQFYPETEISLDKDPWVMQKPVQPLIARYISCRLEQLGCTVETKIYENAS